MVAEKPDASANAGFPPKTRYTIRTLREWEASLREVRQRGYATSTQELYSGITTIPVPVLDSRWVAIAALSFFGRSHDLEQRLPLLVQLLYRAAARISHDVLVSNRNRS